jgi:1-acyl-sn-glycerol-3-phosphate acyltransferase
LTSAALTASAVVWLPGALALDVLRDRARLPRLRAVSIAAVWAGLETIGVAGSACLWVARLANDLDAHYALQRWWALRLLDALRLLANIRFDIDKVDIIAPGPVVLVSRHASMADVLLPVWMLAQHDMRPRYVLGRELLIDPCLDIVGNRLPNSFVARNGTDTAAQLNDLRKMASGMGCLDALVIYPEGGIAHDKRRSAALSRIAASDPDRAARLTSLRRLMPPRHAGLWAILEGSPNADIVFVDHTGLEVINEIRQVPLQIPLRTPISVRLLRVPRAEIPNTRDAFKDWLDHSWLELDRCRATGQ